MIKRFFAALAIVFFSLGVLNAEETLDLLFRGSDRNLSMVRERLAAIDPKNELRPLIDGFIKNTLASGFKAELPASILEKIILSEDTSRLDECLAKIDRFLNSEKGFVYEKTLVVEQTLYREWNRVRAALMALKDCYSDFRKLGISSEETCYSFLSLMRGENQYPVVFPFACFTQAKIYLPPLIKLGVRHDKILAYARSMSDRLSDYTVTIKIISMLTAASFSKKEIEDVCLSYRHVTGDHYKQILTCYKSLRKRGITHSRAAQFLADAGRFLVNPENLRYAGRMFELLFFHFGKEAAFEYTRSVMKKCPISKQDYPYFRKSFMTLSRIFSKERAIPILFELFDSTEYGELGVVAMVADFLDKKVDPKSWKSERLIRLVALTLRLCDSVYDLESLFTSYVVPLSKELDYDSVVFLLEGCAKMQVKRKMAELLQNFLPAVRALKQVGFKERKIAPHLIHSAVSFTDSVSQYGAETGEAFIREVPGLVATVTKNLGKENGLKLVEAALSSPAVGAIEGIQWLPLTFEFLNKSKYMEKSEYFPVLLTVFEKTGAYSSGIQKALPDVVEGIWNLDRFADREKIDLLLIGVYPLTSAFALIPQIVEKMLLVPGFAKSDVLRFFETCGKRLANVSDRDWLKIPEFLAKTSNLKIENERSIELLLMIADAEAPYIAESLAGVYDFIHRATNLYIFSFEECVDVIRIAQKSRGWEAKAVYPVFTEFLTHLPKSGFSKTEIQSVLSSIASCKETYLNEKVVNSITILFDFGLSSSEVALAFNKLVFGKNLYEFPRIPNYVKIESIRWTKEDFFDVLLNVRVTYNNKEIPYLMPQALIAGLGKTVSLSKEDIKRLVMDLSKALPEPNYLVFENLDEIVTGLSTLGSVTREKMFEKIKDLGGMLAFKKYEASYIANIAKKGICSPDDIFFFWKHGVLEYIEEIFAEFERLGFTKSESAEFFKYVITDDSGRLSSTLKLVPSGLAGMLESGFLNKGEAKEALKAIINRYVSSDSSNTYPLESTLRNSYTSICDLVYSGAVPGNELFSLIMKTRGGILVPAASKNANYFIDYFMSLGLSREKSIDVTVRSAYKPDYFFGEIESFVSFMKGKGFTQEQALDLMLLLPFPQYRGREFSESMQGIVTLLVTNVDNNTAYDFLCAFIKTLNTDIERIADRLYNSISALFISNVSKKDALALLLKVASLHGDSIYWLLEQIYTDMLVNDTLPENYREMIK